MKIELHDTFNNRKISTHLTVLAAVRAQRKHIAAVKKANGQNSYLTYQFRYADGTLVSGDDIMQAKMELDYEQPPRGW